MGGVPPAEAVLDELREGGHLVGRVHGDAHDVLRERDLAGLDVAGLDQAGHGMVGADRAVGGQFLQGLEAAPAGDNGVTAVFDGTVCADDEVLQQSERGDRSLELGVGPGIGRGLADVLGGEREPGERDLPDERLGHGGDVVHANLPRWCVETDGRSAGRTAPAAPSAPPETHAPAPPPGGVASRAGCGG